MRLSSHQQKLIAATHIEADRDISEVCKEVGLRDHTVRRGLRMLRESGVLRVRNIIDFYSLGYSEYMLLFSAGALAKSEREIVLDKLASSGRVGYVAELGGEFQYAVSILARNIGEVSQFLRIICGRYKLRILDKNYAIFVEQNWFPAFTQSNGRPRPVRSLGTTKRFVTIDRLDEAILSELGRSITTSSIIARALGLPNSTISYRMNRLREMGVLQNALHDLNLTRYGYHPYAFLVYTRGANNKFYTKLKEFCRNQPNLFRLVQCIGSWDYMVSGDFSDPRDVAELRGALHDAFPSDIRSIKGFTIFSRRKLSHYPFLPPRESAVKRV